jgi:hypothetical protein
VSECSSRIAGDEGTESSIHIDASSSKHRSGMLELGSHCQALPCPTRVAANTGAWSSNGACWRGVWGRSSRGLGGNVGLGDTVDVGDTSNEGVRQ